MASDLLRARRSSTYNTPSGWSPVGAEVITANLSYGVYLEVVAFWAEYSAGLTFDFTLSHEGAGQYNIGGITAAYSGADTTSPLNGYVTAHPVNYGDGLPAVSATPPAKSTSWSRRTGRGKGRPHSPSRARRP